MAFYTSYPFSYPNYLIRTTLPTTIRVKIPHLNEEEWMEIFWERFFPLLVPFITQPLPLPLNQKPYEQMAVCRLESGSGEWGMSTKRRYDT